MQPRKARFSPATAQMSAISNCLFPMTPGAVSHNGNLNLKTELEEIRRMMENCADSETFAGKVSSSLALQGRYDLLKEFLHELGSENTETLKCNEHFLRALIAINFEQENFKEVYSLLKEGKFSSYHGLLEVWDEAHYREKEIALGKTLSPLIKFRVRKRNPPPPNICATGMRPSSKLSEEAKEILKTWFVNNAECPYPSQETKDDLAKRTGLSNYQVKTWFANARRRLKTMSNQVKHENQQIKTTFKLNRKTSPCLYTQQPPSWVHQNFYSQKHLCLPEGYHKSTHTGFGLLESQNPVSIVSHEVSPQSSNTGRSQRCLMDLESYARKPPYIQNQRYSPNIKPSNWLYDDKKFTSPPLNISNKPEGLVRENKACSGGTGSWNVVIPVDKSHQAVSWIDNVGWSQTNTSPKNVGGIQSWDTWNMMSPDTSVMGHSSFVTQNISEIQKPLPGNSMHSESIIDLQGQGYHQGLQVNGQDAYVDPLAEYFINSRLTKDACDPPSREHHIASDNLYNMDMTVSTATNQQAYVKEMEAAETLLDLSVQTHR